MTLSIKKIYVTVLMATLLGLFATGCRYTAAPADLLTKPVIAAEKQALLDVIKASLPYYGKLTLPLRDDQQGAIRMIDLNGDGVEEAVVSYFNEYSTPEIMILRMNSGLWKPWLLVQQPMARQIDWIKLEDFDQDGHIELAVGWIGSYESLSIAEFYSFQTKPIRNDEDKLILQPVTSIPYVYSDMGDINGDGKLELAVISTDGGTIQEIGLKNFRLTLYDLEQDGLNMIQEIALFAGVNSYDHLLIGRVSPRHNGIVVEASTGAHGMYVGMYAWENGKLRLIDPNTKAKNEEDMGIITSPALTEDSNHDGILELVVPKEAPGYFDLSYAEMLFTEESLQWDGKKDFHMVKEKYSDYTYQFHFIIPEQWADHYTLRSPDEEMEYGVVTFEYWNEQTKFKTELATLYAVPQQKWEEIESGWKSQNRPYQELNKGSGLVYVISFVQDPPATLTPLEKEQFIKMQLTEEQLRPLFELFND